VEVYVMKRLLFLLLVMVVLGMASTVGAEPWGGRSNSTDLPARSAVDGGSSLAEGLRWVFRFWSEATGASTKSDVLPPPGITNGSCVDPDGGGRCGH
jgi:hypothetical protein